ncbi:unnamed protein product, partial [marine sediment metagenome]
HYATDVEFTEDETRELRKINEEIAEVRANGIISKPYE